MTIISPDSTAYSQNLAFRANEETQKPKDTQLKLSCYSLFLALEN